MIGGGKVLGGDACPGVHPKVVASPDLNRDGINDVLEKRCPGTDFEHSWLYLVDQHGRLHALTRYPHPVKNLWRFGFDADSYNVDEQDFSVYPMRPEGRGEGIKIGDPIMLAGGAEAVACKFAFDIDDAGNVISSWVYYTTGKACSIGYSPSSVSLDSVKRAKDAK